MYTRTILCLFLGFGCIGQAILSVGQDLEQKPIVIKGETSAPGTIYIAPWKEVGGALDAEPLQPEFELDTRPLDREVFLRELELQRKKGIDSSAVTGESSSSYGASPVENN